MFVFSDVFQCNYFIFFHYSNTCPPQTAEETWTTNLSPAILIILHHLFLTSTHHCPCFKPDTGVICSSNYYLLNMMYVTKNSNQNQLQQVEMRLHQIYLHHTCSTTWSTVHASCIILWTFEDITRSYMKTLAYTTGTSLIRLTQKECFFSLSFPECYPYNRNLWFLLKIAHWAVEFSTDAFGEMYETAGLALIPTFDHFTTVHAVCPILLLVKS